MKLKVIDFLFGACKIKATGTFLERIINIATQKGIFLRSITTSGEKSITFTVSRRGAEMLLNEPLCEGIEIEIVEKSGLPYIFSARKGRRVALFAPLLIMVFLFLSTQIIWHVNVIDATREEEELILAELKKLGVKKGALKFTIDQSHVKNRILIDNPSLMWLWVDLKGASAIVKFAPRDMAPPLYDENEFYNVYSTRDAVITKITATNGVAKVKVGDTVLKGQLLIEGTMPEDGESIKYIHATGEVLGSVWEEKTVIIPKKKEIRTPNGEKVEHLSIKFKNFLVKLYINSSISYPDYDIIENNRIIVPFGPLFTKKEYIAVDVTYEENNIPLMQKAYESEFYASLTDKGYSINYKESLINDKGDSVHLTMRALCEEPVATERRMNLGENYSGTDN